MKTAVLAQEECESHNGKLAKPTTEEEHEEIKGIIRERKVEIMGLWAGDMDDFFADRQPVWLGIQENGTNEITAQGGMNFTRYKDDEPNSVDDRCVYMSAGEGGIWYDSNCNNEFPFVCEKWGKCTSVYEKSRHI